MKRQLLFICLGLVASVSILGISLLKTAHARAATFAQPQTSHKRFYLGKEIKPDHVLYPVVAVADHIKLTSAPLDQKVTLTQQYTHKRVSFTHYLIDQSEPEMAVMTLQRAHSLQLEMVEELVLHSDQSQMEQGLALLEELEQEITQLRQSLPSEYVSTLQLMLQENLIAQEKLRTS